MFSSFLCPGRSVLNSYPDPWNHGQPGDGTGVACSSYGLRRAYASAVAKQAQEVMSYSQFNRARPFGIISQPAPTVHRNCYSHQETAWHRPRILELCAMEVQGKQSDLTSFMNVCLNFVREYFHKVVILLSQKHCCLNCC